MSGSTEAVDLALDPELARLVERTRGLQPLRRLFHAGNGLVVALVPGQLGMSRPLTVAVLAAFFVALLATDWIRLRDPRANALFFRLFPALASPREASGFASSTWYAAGALLTWALFPAPVAPAALLVLGLADPAAGVVGRLWGRRRLGSGTVLGSGAFWLVAAVIMAGVAGPVWGPVAALAVAAVECLPWRVDDNLSVPLAAAGALWLSSA